MNLLVSDGPYVEGNPVNIRCEVDWVKGEVASKYLEVFLGTSLLGRSVMQENIEHSEKFTISKAVVLSKGPRNTNVTCVHHFSNGSLEKFVTITVIKGGRLKLAGCSSYDEH